MKPALVRWTESPWFTVGFGMVVAILTWDPSSIVPGTGLDASWVTSLSVAADSGFDQGTQFVFTYGPLGFLDEPSVAGGLTAALGGIYLLGMRWALASSLLWIGRRSFPVAGAAALAFLITAVTARPVEPLVLTAIWCLVALQPQAPPWSQRLVLIGGGCLAALEVLIKLNIGLGVFGLVAITAVALGGERLRNIAWAAGTFLGVSAVLWLLSGQGIGNIDDFVRSSLQIISGYSESMQIEQPIVDWDRAAAVAAGLATLAATFAVTQTETIGRRIGAFLVVALLIFTLFKQGFVRHDFGHVGLYFGGVAAVWPALLWPRGLTAGLAAIPAVVIALTFYPVTGKEMTDSIQPKQGWDQLRALVDPGRRAELRDFARASMADSYGVNPAILDRIGDSTVDVRPWETGITWAYDLNWDPIGVIQDYQTYTPELDRQNADALASADGPQFMLRHLDVDGTPADIDGRFAGFDAPAETRAVLCNFKPALQSGPYLLEERTADRCGEERPLGTVTADYDEAVPIPTARPGEAVFARVTGAAPAGLEQIRSALYRAVIRRIRLDEADYRFLPRNAEDGLLLRAPRNADLPQPFTLAPGAKTVTVENDGGFASPDGPITFEFYAVPVSPN